MYNYLGLVNGVLFRVNETPLTDVNFASAPGLYADVKQAVNLSIADINTTDYTWPFNHVQSSQLLTVGQVRYPLPTDVKSVGWETFRLRGDNNLQVRTTKLVPIDYEEYLDKFSDMEYQPNNYLGVPSNVFRTRNNSDFGLIQPPNKSYTVDYEYYKIPISLEASTDVPSIPQIFEHVIHSGAMAYAYMFRGDVELSTASFQIFKDQIKNMRIIYINRVDYARGTERIR